MKKHQLTATSLKNAGDGRHYDGSGLIIIKTGQTGKWVWRYAHLGKRRDMGLGPWPQLSLAAARAARDRWQAVLAEGRDPMTVRNQQREEEKAERERHDATLTEVIAAVFEARKDTLRGQGERGRWMSPLKMHVIPKLGDRPVSQLTRHDYANTLRPIWRSMHPTATKAVSRILICLREGKFMGYDCDPFEIQAAERILGDVNHVPRPTPSTPWQDLPAIYAALDESPQADCLRWLILTLVRSHGCLEARKDEIDGDIWTVPKDRVKGHEGSVQDFRVPLSAEAQRVADRARRRVGPYMFPTATGRPVRDDTIEALLTKLGTDGRPHGLRSSFRMWVQDTDACGWEVSETVLNHKIGNMVERAYARSDMIDRRRAVMEAWAAHVTGASSNVVRLRG